MEKADLTTLNDILYLLTIGHGVEGDDGMRGAVRTKEKCPVCDSHFKHIQRVGFICPEHKTMPKKFFIDLFYQGRRIKLYSHKTGRTLDSYGLAFETLEHIRHELRTHTFDPSRYIKAELSKFYISSLINEFISFKELIDDNGRINRGDDSVIAPSYRKDYLRMLRIAKEHFKITDIRDLRKRNITAYYASLQKTGRGSKTIKNIMDVFKTFLHYCKSELEIIDTVPAFPVIEVSEHKFRWLSMDDQVRAFEAVPDADKPIIAFLMLHGCRPSEARALRCRHIDIKTGIITIAATFSGGVYREKRKGRGAKPAVIPIHPETYGYLEDRVKNNLPEAFVFARRNGNYYTENALRHVWDKVRNELGIDKSVRLYDATRHSFASNLINSGVSLFKISKLLGHSNTKMTEKYAHSDVESLRADIHKISLNKIKTVPKLSPEVKQG